MRRISEIISVEKRMKDDKPYWVTLAVAGGDEVSGYGKDFAVGDEVEVFFDDRWGKAKMFKKGVDKTSIKVIDNHNDI